MKGDAALSVLLVFIHLRACLLGGIWGIFLGTSSRFVKLYKWHIAVFSKQSVSNCRNMWMKRNSFIIKSQHTNRQQHQQLVKVHGTYLPSLGCLVNSLHTPMAWVTSLRLFRSNWIRPRVAPTTSTKFKPLIRLSNGSILLFVRGFARFLFGALQQWRFWNLDQKNDI